MEIAFGQLEGCFAVLWLVSRAASWIKNGKFSWKREALLLLLFLDLAVVLRFTFFPRELADGHIPPLVLDLWKVFPLRINWVPFVRLTDYAFVRDLIWNVAGNVLMFVPTGILLPAAYRDLDRFSLTVLAGFMISLCIEILQIPFYARATDVDDLLANTLGAALGYGLLALIRLGIRSRKAAAAQ